MNRSRFLKTTLTGLPLAFTATNLSAKNAPAKANIPAWVEGEIAKTAERIKAHKTPECALFIAITDLHSGLPNKGRDTVSHIRYANLAAEKLGADAVVNLGDWGLEYPIKRDQEGGLELAQTVIKNHSETSIPTIFCVGNHDHFYKRFSNEFLGWLYTPLCKDAVRSKAGDYGYLDLPKKKCRVFFLNSSELTTAAYGFSNEQMKFLKENLEKMPKDYTAVIFDHYCFDELGEWKYYKMGKEKNRDTFRKIMMDFVKSGGKLAGNIVGDSHFDRTFNREGVNFFISQGYAGVGAKYKPDDVEIVKFSHNKNMLAEAILINSNTREIRFFRIGAGGASRDRYVKF